MGTRSVYLTPEFKKAYQSKTGKALTSSVVDDMEYTRLAGEVGGATPTAADKTFLGATRTNSGVSVDGASPLSNPAVRGGTLGADRIGSVQKPVQAAASQNRTAGTVTQSGSQSQAGSLFTGDPTKMMNGQPQPAAKPVQGSPSPLSVFMGVAGPGRDAPDDKFAQALVNAGVPVQAAVTIAQNRNGGLGQAVPDQGSQTPSFEEFLAAMGFTLPKVPDFNFNPNAAYQAALGEAELAVAPQREALQFQTDRTIRDQRARAESQRTALRESQARRRLFTSPVGAFLEAEQQRLSEQGIRDVEANRDMRLQGLELQKASRALSRVQAMQREAYGNYARAVSATTQQFNALVNLYDKTMDNIRAGNKDQATLAKWMADLAIKQQDADTRTFNAETSAYRADAYAQSVANQATKAAGQYLQNWAKIRSSNLVKFGIEAGKLVNDAIEAALAGDDEGANRLMEKAASAKQTKDESEALTKTAHKTFQSAAVKYGPQVAAAIVAGMMETDPRKQQAWFLLAEEGISDKLAEAEGYKADLEAIRQQGRLELEQIRQEGQNYRAQYNQLMSSRRTYRTSFGLEAGDLIARADEAEIQGDTALAAYLYGQAGEAYDRHLMQKNNKTPSPSERSFAWRSATAELGRIANDMMASPAQRYQMANQIADRWASELTDAEIKMLANMIATRFPAPKEPKQPETNRHSN